jgi:hypothetical protein
MSSPRLQISRLLLLPALAVASSCAEQGAITPPVPDLQAVVEAKPQPTDDIVTSQQAYDQYQASLESWGDRISAAGGRLCRWSERVYKVKAGCPKP